jgi:hypothetical protein
MVSMMVSTQAVPTVLIGTIILTRPMSVKGCNPPQIEEKDDSRPECFSSSTCIMFFQVASMALRNSIPASELVIASFALYSPFNLT